MKEAAEEKVDKVVNFVQASPLDEMVKQIEVSIQFRHLEARKTAVDSRFTSVRYPISIYLGEAVGNHKSKAVVPFTIEARTEPDVATFTLKGDACIQGLPEEIEPWVIPKGDKAPRVWTKIYREAVAMLTILAKFIDVPSPLASSSEE